MKQISVLALLAVLSTSLSAAPPQAQGTAGTSTTKSTTRKTTTTRRRTAATTSSAAATSNVTTELQQMKAALDAQQQQIQQLRQDLAARDQQIREAQQQAQQAQQLARDAQSRTETVASTASTNDQTISTLKTDVADMKLNATNNALTMQEAQKAINESPLAIRFKGITITPGGFLAAETVWRQRGQTSEINTPFNAIPLAGFGQYRQSEFFASGRPSRITILGEGSTSKAKFTGYYEGDFNSAGVTSNNNQSNSYTFRQRQAWGQATLISSGLSFTGGQMWSLVTETRNGLDNRTETPPSVIDHAYNVGFSWARQYGFRVVKNFNNKVWFGFSVENAQTSLTAHGNLSNFVIGNAGTLGGLYNNQANYSFNVQPDYVVKAAFQPGFGHYEVFGLVRSFRARIYPNVTSVAATSTSVGAFNDTKVGGGIGANARWLFANKHLEFGIHALGGDGVGRYGASGLPDTTVRQDGTLALLHGVHGLGTFEVHYPKLDVYFNGGTEHVSRYWQTRAQGAAQVPVGYGSPLFSNATCLIEAVPGGGNGFTPGNPATCNNDTRSLQEYTVGFYYKFYNGPKGRVQWGPQYSHIIRYVWAGVGGAPKAEQNMVMTSFRYYLP